LLQNAYTIFKNAMNNHWKENSEQNTICHRKKPTITGRNFLSHEEAFKDEHNAEEEMEIANNQIK
jgi:hypothetical protein